MGEEEMSIVRVVTTGTTSQTGGIMTTEGTMTATVHATETVVATDVATSATAVVIMKDGTVTVDATNATTLTVIVGAIPLRADVPGVGDGMTDHGHLGVVHVSHLRPSNNMLTNSFF